MAKERQEDGNESDESESDPKELHNASSEEQQEEMETNFENLVGRLETKSKQNRSKKVIDEKEETEEDDGEDEQEISEESASEMSADEEELDLEEAVFGAFARGSSKIQEELGRVIARKRAREEQSGIGEDTFFIDRSGEGSEGESNEGESEDHKDETENVVEKAAWVDEDDFKTSKNLVGSNRLKKLRETQDETFVGGSVYEARLRKLRSKLNEKLTGWATLPQGDKKNVNDDNEDSEEEEEEYTQLLRNSNSFSSSMNQSGKISAGKLLLSRLNDLNQHGPSDAVVQAVNFHRNGLLALTAGFDKKLRVFHTDGKENALIESLYFPDMPIFSAHFSGRNHEQILCSGRRSFFYWVDLESGKAAKIPKIQGRDEKSLESMSVGKDGSLVSFLGYDGNIILLSQSNKRWVGNLKMNENGSCAEFSENGLYLYSSGDKGNVYIWDLRMRQLLSKFRDEGSICTRSLAVSSDCRRIAVGSTNGVVNLYDSENISSGVHRPKPTKAIMNLTTPVDHLEFNHDGQLLAMLSRRKKDAVRLFNVDALSVVPNWPTSSTPIQYGSTITFSPNSDKLVIGNGRGRCLMYQLHHYKPKADK